MAFESTGSPRFAFSLKLSNLRSYSVVTMHLSDVTDVTDMGRIDGRFLAKRYAAARCLGGTWTEKVLVPSRHEARVRGFESSRAVPERYSPRTRAKDFFFQR